MVVAKRRKVGVLAIVVLWVGERVNKNMPIIVGQRRVVLVTKRVTGPFMFIVLEVNCHNCLHLTSRWLEKKSVGESSPDLWSVSGCANSCKGS